jgi:hypothetical protein
MKYPYYIDYIDPESPLVRLPEEIMLASLFLFCDVQGSLYNVFSLEEINSVLQGEIPTSEIGGNMCGLKIEKDYTTIINMLAEDEEDPKSMCVIETEELKKLILFWIDLKKSISYVRMLCEAEERHTDPVIAIPVLPLQRTSRNLPAERKEELMAIPA